METSMETDKEMDKGNEAGTARRSTLIAIDTSTAAMTVALHNGRLLGESDSQADRNHSMYIIPAMQELMRSHHIQPGELGAIAVGVGPGSYTGVRIGVSVAKTCAWTLGIPVIGVSSLEACAWGGLDIFSAKNDSDAGEQAGEGAVWVVPLINARRGQAFTAIYAMGRDAGTRMQAQVEEQAQAAEVVADGIRLVDAWVEQIGEKLAQTDTPPGQVLFCGETDGFAEHMLQLTDGWRTPVALVSSVIRARDMARIARSRWLRGEVDETHNLAPNYTQLAEAEVKLLAKMKANG
ncbi:MAG: tRNA threonylcarbamoyladenosine biosynthesis protein TsaB [Paenibacillaceae bacterium]|nr:tRNA threonylcarbamoyladenosine biosynthesis protein TsaB [Paenibacillaceae bacterium]